MAKINENNEIKKPSPPIPPKKVESETRETYKQPEKPAPK